MDVGVDVSGLTSLARVLNKVEPSLSREFRQGIDVAAEIVAAKARSNAGFSSRIPATVKVVRRGPVGRRIRAGGDAAPHAAALDNKGNPGTFRHPVFGQDVWVDQPAQPFMGIDDQTADAGVTAIEVAVDRALKGISVV